MPSINDIVTTDRTAERDKRGACMRCETSRATTKREYERTGKWNACQPCAEAMDKWHAERELLEAAKVETCLARGTHRPEATDEHISGWICADCQLPKKTAYRLAPTVLWDAKDAVTEAA